MPNLSPPSPAFLVLVLLLAFNLGVLVMFAIDKHAAKHRQQRVPERRLILAIVLFGATGAVLGQRLFRHKTRKAPFSWLVPLMMVIQIAGAGLVPVALAVQNS